MTTYATQTPYLASFVILENKEGKIALVLRTGTGWMDDHYGLPSGKVEVNEFFAHAAIREAKEEVGVEIEPEDLLYVMAQHYIEKEDPKNCWVNVFYKVKKWRGDPYNAEPDKHGELTWSSPDTLPNNMVPAVRHALEQIGEGKSYCEFNWRDNDEL